MQAMRRTLAIVNQKGGVGKTTVTLGLASAAAAAGRRVLVVDLDPQASTSWVLGIDPDTGREHRSPTCIETKRRGLGDVIRAVRHGRSMIDVLPSAHLDCRSLEVGSFQAVAPGADGRSKPTTRPCSSTVRTVARQSHAQRPHRSTRHAVLVVEPSSHWVCAASAASPTSSTTCGTPPTRTSSSPASC